MTTPAIRLVFASTIALAAVASAETRRAVEFARPDGVPLLLDAITPPGAGPFPVVFFVHGGGWASGDRTSDAGSFVPSLTAAGFAFVSIDYRLAPACRWPAPIDDVRAALRWIAAHAAEFGGDPSRIAILGYSSGGHLALLAACDPRAGDPPLRAVVGLAPPSDFEQDLVARGGLSKSLQDLLDRPQAVDDAALATLRAIGPIHFVRPGLPPFLIVQGDADKTVPPPQSIAFAAACKAAGVPCELILIPGAGHRIREWRNGDPRYQQKLTTWLGDRLVATTRPTTQR